MKKIDKYLKMSYRLEIIEDNVEIAEPNYLDDYSGQFKLTEPLKI